MANVKFLRSEFEKEIKLTKEVLEKISLMGTPLESLTDEEIEIEIFPNRPDLLSMQGYLRALRAFLNKSPGLQKYKINKPEKDFKVTIQPEVKQVRPYTVCAIVKNLKFDDAKIKTLVDLQEKLHTTIGRNRKKAAIGIYPLEKIKLPITYTALAPDKIKFTPLESDREMTGPQILQRLQAGRGYAHLLENQEVFPVFQDANKQILSMPPIINSHTTGKITKETKEVFVECSGSNLEILKKILNILVTTLSDIGGKVYAINIQDKKESSLTTPDLTSEKIKISLENTNKLLGLDLETKDLEKLIPKMGYDYNASKNEVSIPGWRTDILHEVDIIEDIAIAYGYQNFKPSIPKVATSGAEDPKNNLKTKIAESLAGLGLIETSTFHLIKDSELKIMKIPKEKQITTVDSKTEYKTLRPNLLIPALRILSENKDSEYPQKTFEIGTTFPGLNSKEESGIEEEEELIISLTPSNFTQAKQTLDYLFRSLNLTYELKESTHSELIEGRCANVIVNEKVMGKIGEVHPETLRKWGLKMPLTIIQLNLDKILNN